MIVCHACNRPYRFEDLRCPFCSTPHRTTVAGFGAAAALASGLMLFACNGDDESESSDTTDSTGDETGTSETGDETDSGDTTTSTDTSGGTEYGGPPPSEPDDWR